MVAPTRGWPAGSHEALLLCFIEEAFAQGDNKKTLIKGVTARMNQMGHTYSFDAIKYCSLSCVSLFPRRSSVFSVLLPSQSFTRADNHCSSYQYEANTGVLV
jgi:hypothetical protein